MGLIILFSVGAILGWLASIVLRREQSQDILLNVAVGIVGAILGGTLSSTISVLGGITATALLVAVVAACVAIAVFNLFRRGALASSANE